MKTRGSGTASSTVANFTSGTITGTNVPYAVAKGKWGVPIIWGTTASMGNNGAVTWTTALPNAFTGGAWVIMPAGSIAAGVPAATAILWYVGTDTTHGTFFNSTIDLTNPGAAGTATAFATTGPGAFTGITAQTTVATIAIPANTLAANGKLTITLIVLATSSANAKTASGAINSTEYFGQGNTNLTGARLQTEIFARGGSTTGADAIQQNFNTANAALTGVVFDATVDWTTGQTFTLKGTRVTATENMIYMAVDMTAIN